MMFYSIPPFLTLSCYVALGLLALHRGLKTPVNRLLFLICLTGTFLYLDILIIFNVTARPIALMSSRLDHCCVVFTIPLFIHFFHLYLQITGRKWVLWTAYAYACGLMPFAFTPLLIEEMQLHAFGYFGRGGPLYPLIGVGALAALLYCLLILGLATMHEKSSIQKNKLKYLYTGFGMMGVLNGLNVLPILGYPVYPPGTFSFIPLVIFAIGLFRYDLLDMGVILKKSLLYSLLTACLLCIYSLVITLTNKTLNQHGFGDSLFSTLVFFLLVATLLGPLKTRMQQYLDRIFYRKQYDYPKTLRKLGQTIASTLNVHTIAGHLSDTVVQKILLTHCRLFLKSHSGQAFQPVVCSTPAASLPSTSPLVGFIKKHRQAAIKKKLLEQSHDTTISRVLVDMQMLSAEVVLPLVFNDRFNGFICFGQKMSGELFSQEDIDLLATLSLQTSLAIENAASYRRLDELNKSLESRVQKRTKALQQALLEKDKTQEQLVRSESVASIGLLVAGTAHELNNPLTAAISLIQSTIEDLGRQDNPFSIDAHIIPDLLFAGRELGRAKSIISSLLGLSRQTRTYSEKVDLDVVIGDAMRVLENQFKPACPKITTRLDGSLPLISGNFAGLGQVVINIVKNAIQAVAQIDGRVSLTTDYEPRERQVVFSCRDTGIGVTPAVRKDMFKPFFTTKEVGEGTGLGLYICHEIVEKHNGSIHIESGPETGTLFQVKLPAAPAKEASFLDTSL